MDDCGKELLLKNNIERERCKKCKNSYKINIWQGMAVAFIFKQKDENEMLCKIIRKTKGWIIR